MNARLPRVFNAAFLRKRPLGGVLPGYTYPGFAVIRIKTEHFAYRAIAGLQNSGRDLQVIDSMGKIQGLRVYRLVSLGKCDLRLTSSCDIVSPIQPWIENPR